MKKLEKGFTLIELLVVIAILAVLSVAVVLVLNPAELIRQGRDATRMSDLASINSAISLLTADNPGATWYATSTCTSGTTLPSSSAVAATCTANATTSISGTTASDGWVNLNLSSISSGSPLPRLPLDPSSSTSACAGTVPGCFYAYKSSSTIGVYKIFANMESTKYGKSGSSDVESNTKDGGVVDDWYEVGSNLSLR